MFLVSLSTLFHPERLDAFKEFGIGHSTPSLLGKHCPHQAVFPCVSPPPRPFSASISHNLLRLVQFLPRPSPLVPPFVPLFTLKTLSHISQFFPHFWKSPLKTTCRSRRLLFFDDSVSPLHTPPPRTPARSHPPFFSLVPRRSVPSLLIGLPNRSSNFSLTFKDAGFKGLVSFQESS